MGKSDCHRCSAGSPDPSLLFEPYLVEGSSMYPTLHDGERLFVNKTVNYIGESQRGDIVIINGETSKSIM